MHILVRIGMIAPTGVNDLARAQNGTAIFAFAIAFGSARRAGGELFADIFGKRDAATGACITLRSTKSIQTVGVSASVLRFQKVRVIFDVLR